MQHYACKRHTNSMRPALATGTCELHCTRLPLSPESPPELVPKDHHCSAFRICGLPAKASEHQILVISEQCFHLLSCQLR